MGQCQTIVCRWAMLASIYIFLGSLAGCAVISGNLRWEPATIVIRNNSEKNLRMVSLSEVAQAGTHAIQYGSISPVPPGTDQAVTRPPHSSPLPEKIEIGWIDDQDRRYIKKINLKKILESNIEQDNHMMVFQILPSGEISIIFE